MIVDPVYSPRQIDLVKGLVPIRGLFHRTTSAAAAQIIIETTRVTPEFALVLTHYRMFIDPGAGQNIVGATLTIRDEANNVLLNIAGSGALAADANFTERDDLEIYVLPGELLRGQFDFNAGVAANLATVSLHGILVPFANFQRGSI